LKRRFVSQHYADRLQAAIHRSQTPAVVGLDPVLEWLPDDLRPARLGFVPSVDALEHFCRQIIDLVAPIVPAVKINSAFFEAYHDTGTGAYYRLIEHAHRQGLLVIGDVKRADIGHTARWYALGHLTSPGAVDVNPARIPDAVTIGGYFGEASVRPFIEAAVREGRGVYVLVRPSDPDSQAVHEFGGEVRLYELLGRFVRRWGEGPGLTGACGLSCVGAVVAPHDASSTGALRAALPHTPFLVPGYGAQGAGAQACRPCFLPDGSGAVVNASRSVIYAYRDAAALERSNGDWRACVRAACCALAADLAPLAGFPADGEPSAAR
jgi:orotidine-5'-phosphate decarboxylase